MFARSEVEALLIAAKQAEWGRIEQQPIANWNGGYQKLTREQRHPIFSNKKIWGKNSSSQAPTFTKKPSFLVKKLQHNLVFTHTEKKFHFAVLIHAMNID